MTITNAIVANAESIEVKRFHRKFKQEPIACKPPPKLISSNPSSISFADACCEGNTQPVREWRHDFGTSFCNLEVHSPIGSFKCIPSNKLQIFWGPDIAMSRQFCFWNNGGSLAPLQSLQNLWYCLSLQLMERNLVVGDSSINSIRVFSASDFALLSLDSSNQHFFSGAHTPPSV